MGRREDMDKKDYLKIIEWATGDDTGASSKALCRFMLGLEHDGSVPSDAGDRGRCIRLLDLIPEWWDRLDEVASLPSHEVVVISSKEIGREMRGWKEQIPLIKKEGKHE